MKIVLAGTYQQYTRWRRDNDVGPRDSMYVIDLASLLGLRLKPEDEIIEVGTFWEDKKDAYEIKQYLRRLADIEGIDHSAW